jgi:CheY-like chemotaxis protein
VLLIEDEPDSAEFVKHLLEMHGAEVLVAGSARDALQHVTHTQLDMIISDIGLPEMDGYELMAEIRQRHLGDDRGIPAVALTAYARSDDRTRALLAGYQAHLTKPVDPTELVATVASFTEFARARRNERSPDPHA